MGREVELPHLSLLPKFQDYDQHPEPFGLEEEIDRVLEDMVGGQWSGPLIVNRFVNDTMIEIKEI